MCGWQPEILALYRSSRSNQDLTGLLETLYPNNVVLRADVHQKEVNQCTNVSDSFPPKPITTEGLAFLDDDGGYL